MRKEDFIISVLFTVSIVNLSAQNLVPNSSFEDTLHCPSGLDQIYNSPPWFDPNNGSPDYLNSCAMQWVNVPNNWWGHQYARTGQAYAGTGSIYYNNIREYIEIRLIDSLIQNKKYCVEFYISLADSVSAAVDDMGPYLSTDSIYGSAIYLPYTPQIRNPSGNIISDSINWIKISGYYIAGGGNL